MVGEGPDLAFFGADAGRHRVGLDDQLVLEAVGLVHG
jgi:hypothetical protein